jgi:hypothetical protein
MVGIFISNFLFGDSGVRFLGVELLIEFAILT